VALRAAQSLTRTDQAEFFCQRPLAPCIMSRNWTSLPRVFSYCWDTFQLGPGNLAWPQQMGLGGTAATLMTLYIILTNPAVIPDTRVSDRTHTVGPRLPKSDLTHCVTVPGTLTASRCLVLSWLRFISRSGLARPQPG
jgi:hypothetical protein